MSRPRRQREPKIPAEILSEDGTQKAALMRYDGIVIADYYRRVGAMSGTLSWRWDRRAEVRMQPLDAALVAIQRIVNTPFVKRR